MSNPSGQATAALQADTPIGTHFHVKSSDGIVICLQYHDDIMDGLPMISRQTQVAMHEIIAMLICNA